ncbi:hypothetical protein SLA2020_003620 [Shorea laevis]
MVTIIKHMVDAERSMRCFLKGTSNNLHVQISSSSDNNNDAGDGGGIPVFSFWSISSLEKLAEELVQMFKLELSLKRLLVVELLSISYKVRQVNEVYWSNELYLGEFKDLVICNLCYLTNWLTEVNIDSHRVDEIFAIIKEEMHVTFS